MPTRTSMRAIPPILLIAMSCPDPAMAGESREFWGHTVEGWSLVLRDKTKTEVDRLRAVWALGCFGPEARAAIPDLTEELRRGEIKDEVIDTLVRIGAKTDQTVPSLIERFHAEGCGPWIGFGMFGLYDLAERQLVRVGGPAVPALLDILNGPDRKMRDCAAAALGEIGPAARAAIPALIRAIEDPDPDSEALRFIAATALGRIGPEARAAVPSLTGLLGRHKHGNDVVDFDDDFDVVIALERIGVPPTRKLIDTFLHREGDPSVARQLAWLGPKAREAVPSLRHALTDERPQVRLSAAVALAHIEPSDTAPIPILVEALDHLHDKTLEVGEVFRALALFGPRARAAIPKLSELIRKGDDYEEVFEALVEIDLEGKECVPALVEALKHKDYDVADMAARYLGLLGPRAKDAVSALAVTVTRDFDGEFSDDIDPQANAARALRRIGPDAKPAIPALIAALKHRRLVSRHLDGEEKERDCTAAAAAAQALGGLGIEAKAAIPALMEAIRTREEDDANWPLRREAMMALGRMGPDARAAIPVILDVMKEVGEMSWHEADVAAALYPLAPEEGKTLAEAWLSKHMAGREKWPFRLGLETRALVLGTMGRTSFETDWLTLSDLEQLDWMLANGDPRVGDPIESLEWWFEEVGQLRGAGRLAVPRLNEYRNHPNPWVRLWATEALEQVMPPARR